MILPALLLLAGPATAVPPPADPATVTVDTADADRFAALFRRTGGRPTAAQLQRDYLDRGSYGVHVFMDGRIENATALAAYIAAHQAEYRTAIERCLPVAKAATADLRAIYAALHRLYPARLLPHLYIVFGRGNSGGTAGPGAQVLGLETLCRIADDAAALRTTLRHFFAHETVHTWQRDLAGPGRNPLLGAVLLEGAADYVASRATGKVPDPARAAWAAAREAELWRELDKDLAIVERDPSAPAAKAVSRRWVGNYSTPPAGWPSELGYWMGMRLWQRYVATAPDPAVAQADVLDWRDAAAVYARGRPPA